MVPIERITDSELLAFARKASVFLRSHPWCVGIYSGKLAWSAEGKFGVFLFKIIPAGPEVDDTLWVVTGDLPAAYLVCEDTPSWRHALYAYVSEMQRWVDAVRGGLSLDGIIPVAVAPTPEHAQMLAVRLSFISDKILGPRNRRRRR